MTRTDRRTPSPGHLATLAAALGLLLLAIPAGADPRPFRIAYLLTSDDSEIGEVEQVLEATGPGRWRFASRVEPSGILATLVGGTIAETTELSELGIRLRPLHYTFQRRGLGLDRDVSVRFDWARGRVVNELNGSRWTMNVPESALDKHSLVLAVAMDLRAGALAPSYPVADGGRLKTYTYERLGNERLTTPLGIYDTVKLRRVRPGPQPETLFWHAPALDHLPVRIERRDGEGRVLRMTLSRYAASGRGNRP